MAHLDARREAVTGEPLGAILSANPGIGIDMQTWTWVGYKGGSEPGVLNLTWLLHHRDGRHMFLSLGLNDEARGIDTLPVATLARSAMDFLAAQ
jgi:hypothetical protein